MPTTPQKSKLAFNFATTSDSDDAQYARKEMERLSQYLLGLISDLQKTVSNLSGVSDQSLQIAAINKQIALLQAEVVQLANRPISSPGGNSGDIQYNNLGAFAGYGVGAGLGVLAGSLIGVHNAMSPLQGGIAGEYFHLSSDQYDIATSAHLTAISLLPDSLGWLHNNGTGTFVYSTPTKADVGLGNVENTALSTWAGSTNLTTLGVLPGVVTTNNTGYSEKDSGGTTRLLLVASAADDVHLGPVSHGWSGSTYLHFDSHLYLRGTANVADITDLGMTLSGDFGATNVAATSDVTGSRLWGTDVFGGTVVSDDTQFGVSGGGAIALSSSAGTIQQSYLLSNWYYGGSTPTDRYARNGGSGLILLGITDSPSEGYGPGDIAILTAPTGVAGDHIPWARKAQFYASAGTQLFDTAIDFGPGDGSTTRARMSYASDSYLEFGCNPTFGNSYIQAKLSGANAVLNLNPNGGDVIAWGLLRAPSYVSTTNIYEGDTNATSSMAVNYFGYQQGTTQYRNYRIYDGKNNLIQETEGSSKITIFHGDLRTTAALTTGNPSGGTAQPWKLGDYTAGAAAQSGKVRVEINGVAYDLLTA